MGEESQNIESFKSSKSANLPNAKNAQSHFKDSLTNSSQPYKIPHFSFSQRKSNEDLETPHSRLLRGAEIGEKGGSSALRPIEARSRFSEALPLPKERKLFFW
ncbi:hypothetical protein [Helicobacter turcicus]|uniref:Uncharacterized protein n=1 Tax=Helicobacter turcicus TaxID=2867412 RepID=A0ABS7JQ70_9HELI|nr:hypothetical protein [Helicobacter turcicus]MBX7491542.1 hypothetical protein [Helicobacter turcicus]MBX7546396.1 hypothetical protein [Helicobacter turcicus]